jgi:Pyridoxal/pyridoxine/pyridoxamine kinase
MSTHTGGFTGFTMRDTTSEMSAITNHWEVLGLAFDAIYTGFLGSAEQIRVIASALNRFGGSALKLIDPVMGDDGKLYSTITTELVNGMRTLAAHADLITPNLTEAHLLLGGNPAAANGAHTEEEVRRIAEALRERFSPAVVITGVRCGEGTVSTACLDSAGYRLITKPRIPKSYPGTGDIFASVLLGRLLSDTPLGDASEEASEFVRFAIEDTAAAGTPEREGVLLEKNLYRLTACKS